MFFNIKIYYVVTFIGTQDTLCVACMVFMCVSYKKIKKYLKIAENDGEAIFFFSIWKLYFPLIAKHKNVKKGGGTNFYVLLSKGSTFSIY